LSGQHFCTSWVDTNNKALTIKTCFNLKVLAISWCPFFADFKEKQHTTIII
ncbi:17169_t:CDS:2, partial [Entrophospora sp. SA101]